MCNGAYHFHLLDVRQNLQMQVLHRTQVMTYCYTPKSLVNSGKQSCKTANRYSRSVVTVTKNAMVMQMILASIDDKSILLV